jgi:hypothetical protein
MYFNSALATRFIDQESKYTSLIDFSASTIGQSDVSQIAIMIPMLQRLNHLTLLDIKYNHYNKKKISEYNLGLVYRYNFQDKWIWGLYNYWDHRKINSDLYFNQWTLGSEVLSPYFDCRINFYMPTKNTNTIYSRSPEFKREGTSIYAITGGGVVGRALPGYDVELGVPVFGLVPEIDKKIGTKIFLTKYDFRKKNVQNYSGVKFRLEQKAFESILNKKNITLTLHIGIQYTKQNKRNNFVGISIRLPLFNQPSYKTQFQKRMMDNVVRNIDIVTTEYRSALKKEPLYWNSREIKSIYFVNERTKEGDGSYEAPFSRKQCIQLIKDKKLNPNANNLIVSLNNDEPLVDNQYSSFIRKYSIVNHENATIEFKDHNADISFNIKDYFPILYQRKFSIIDHNYVLNKISNSTKIKLQDTRTDMHNVIINNHVTVTDNLLPKVTKSLFKRCEEHAKKSYVNVPLQNPTELQKSMIQSMTKSLFKRCEEHAKKSYVNVPLQNPTELQKSMIQSMTKSHLLMPGLRH